MRRLILGLGLLLLPIGLSAKRVDLLILQTSDVHAHVGEGIRDKSGDWLHLARTIRRLRRKHGADRTLLIDCGDTGQGTLLGTFTRGEIALDVLRALHYDVWVPGNHELDFGPRRLFTMCTAAGVPTLCGNLRIRAPDGTMYALPPWRTFARGGAKIVVIGATASYLDQWFPGDVMRDIGVDHAVSLVQKILPDIERNHPDLVILAVHQGWLESDPRGVNEVRQIAARFPEIDLILGAHTHRLMPGRKIGPGTWYVQPGAYATHVAAVRVTVDTRRHRPIDIRSELIEADERPDADLQRLLRPVLSAAGKRGATPVCDLAHAVSSRGTPGVSCQTSELICRALAEKTGADVVLHGRLSRYRLPAGPLLEKDLFALVPYENTIVLAKLTAKDLEVIVAEQLRKRSSYVYCGPWGAVFDIRENPARDPAEATVRMRGGGPEDKRFLTAFNSYTASGGGGRFPRLRAILQRPDVACRNTGISSRQAVREYLRFHASDSIEAERWIRGRLSAFDSPRRSH